MATAHGLIEFTVGTQNIVNNYTPVTANFYAIWDSGYAYSGYTTYPRLTLDGTTETKSLASYSISSSNTKIFLGSITKNVYHNSDGTKTISASFSWDPDNEYLSTVTGSASKTLTTIPRATTPLFSATSVALNGSVTITLRPADSSFKHKIRYWFGGFEQQVDGLSIGWDFTGQGNQSVTFTPPESFGSAIPAANSGWCEIRCYTYTSSGTHIGTVKSGINITVPSYTPTISNITLTGNNLLSGAYVRGKSSVTADAELNSYYYAYITNVVATVDGQNFTEVPFTSEILSSGSKKVKFTITDSRGKTASLESSAFTVYDYAAPQITTFTLARQSNGTTVIATVKGSIAAVNNKNAKTIKVTLNGVTNTITSSTYAINGTTTFTNVPTDSTLTATATFTDSYTTVTKNATLPTVAVTMDFHNSGKGIAMGKVAEKENLFDVAWDVKTDGNLNVAKNATITGSASIGGDVTLGGKNLLDYAQTKHSWGKNTVLYAAQTVANSYGNTLTGASVTLEANSTYLVLVGVMVSDGAQTTFSDILLAGIETGGEILISCSGRGGAYAGGGTTGFAIVKTTSSTFVRCQSHGYKNGTFSLYMRTVAIKLDT